MDIVVGPIETYDDRLYEAKEAMNSWASLILKTQGDGNFEFAQKFDQENGIITEELGNDLASVNNAGIPKDIRFNQGLEVLGLE